MLSGRVLTCRQVLGIVDLFRVEFEDLLPVPAFLSAPLALQRFLSALEGSRFSRDDTPAIFRLDTLMDAVEDIKSRLDVADVVGEYIQLKTAGSGSFKAVCPFHQEKTPSFYVSRPRQTWHCFGCDQGGDLISFVMKMEGMEFREALELLAQKAGVQLPAFDGKASSQKKRLHEVNELAMRFFRAALHTLPQAEHARAYVAKRGVDDLTADLFQIGYAPDAWDALTTALQAKGVTADELLQAGLVAKRERAAGVYDRFRNRLMFPIADMHGNIVGFTGRILSDSKEAKYVNTPETPAYRKSQVLYGLDKAKGDIRRQDLAVIVEGNMDVVGSHQFGVTNVVAASGTALTAEQLALLKRFTTNLAIAFDQDNAGNAATLRGLDLARAQDFNIKIITLPPEAGKDPDDAVRKDPELWREAIKQAVGIMDWVYRQAFRDQGMVDSGEDKKEIARKVLPEIKRISDPVERDHWMKKLAHDLDVSRSALEEAVVKLKSVTPAQTRVHGIPMDSRFRGNDTVNAGSHHEKSSPLEERVLGSAISRPGLLEVSKEFGLVEADFSDQHLQALYASLVNAYSGDEISTSRPDSVSGQPIRPPASLTPDQATRFDALAFLAEREFQGMTLEEIKRELKTGVEKLRLVRKNRERELLEQEMRMAERLGDQAKIAELLRRFESLK